MRTESAEAVAGLTHIDSVSPVPDMSSVDELGTFRYWPLVVKLMALPWPEVEATRAGLPTNVAVLALPVLSLAVVPLASLKRHATLGPLLVVVTVYVAT